MKYFFEEEARIIDLICNNVELVKVTPAKGEEKAIYTFTISNHEVVKDVREILNQVYESAFIKEPR